MSDKTIAVQVDPFVGNGVDGYGTISGEQVIQLLLRLPYMDEDHQREAQSNMLKNPYRLEAIVVDRDHYRYLCEIAEQMRTALTHIVEAQVTPEIGGAIEALAKANKHGSR